MNDLSFFSFLDERKETKENQGCEFNLVRNIHFLTILILAEPSCQLSKSRMLALIFQLAPTFSCFQFSLQAH
jgi:hypothetical protein